ncbi:cytochrome P450 [Catenulispora subtropica]|uniref:Cytochrome P450 n=1 Tax=Catenulispora subtropica TaxID=450798 RepID=A0ABN2RD64_9ACTN
MTTSDTPALPDFPLDGGPHGAPSPAWSALRAAGPVARLRAPSGTEVHVATRYDDVEFVHRALSRRAAVAAGAEFFSGENHNAGTSLTTMDPPEHTRLRALVGAPFAPRRVAAWEPMVRRTAEEVVAALRAGGDAGDLVPAFCLELPVRVICELMGVARTELPRFRTWTSAVVTSTGMPAAERLRLVDEFRAHVTAMVAARVADPGTGLVGDLIRARAEDGGRLSEDELVSLVLALIVGGHETTAAVLARGTLTLLRHPEALAELRADPALWPAAVEEILRYDSTSTGGMTRGVVEDVVLPSGAGLAAGSAVIGQLAAANFDPERFPEPERFDLHRPDRRHLSFGQGPHFCAGAPLARMELRIGFSVLFDACPDLRLTVPAEELEWTEGTRVRALRRLPVAWGPREA